MTSITVAGGIYQERCIWPEWNQLYGSAGRAAVALSGHVPKVTLCGYATPEVSDRLRPHLSLYGFTFDPAPSTQTISFEYVHSLGTPMILPHPAGITQNQAFIVNDKVVLRFGMMEGSAQVEAERCVYDPQSAHVPEAFHANKSRASHLAIVGNTSEIQKLGGQRVLLDSARALISRGAEVVVVKSGPNGALIVSASTVENVPAYQTSSVWKIGSGDVFAAIFAARWGVHCDEPTQAAHIASRAVANYVENMSLPTPSVESLMSETRSEITGRSGKVYLAGPFFTLAQRWLIDETRSLFSGFGLEVFSPVHDVGPGPAEVVAPADIEALRSCDRVFAILDGLDAGTIFEVGFARALGIPVYVLAQNVDSENLKMVTGSGCNVFYDYVSAIHHTAWRT